MSNRVDEPSDRAETRAGRPRGRVAVAQRLGDVGDARAHDRGRAARPRVSRSSRACAGAARRRRRASRGSSPPPSRRAPADRSSSAENPRPCARSAAVRRALTGAAGIADLERGRARSLPSRDGAPACPAPGRESMSNSLTRRRAPPEPEPEAAAGREAVAQRQVRCRRCRGPGPRRRAAGRAARRRPATPAGPCRLRRRCSGVACQLAGRGHDLRLVDQAEAGSRPPTRARPDGPHHVLAARSGVGSHA